MPFLRLVVARTEPLTADLRVRLQAGLLALIVETLRKKAAVTSILIEEAALSGWSVGGKSPRSAANLEISVTAGSNTAEEKGRFVAEGYQLLRTILGEDLCETTYVTIHEMSGDAWGYGGRTQAERAR